MTDSDVLAAGDRFVLNSLFADALRREVPSQKVPGAWRSASWTSRGRTSRSAGSPRWTRRPAPRTQMIEALRGAEVCVTHLAPLTEKILDASPDLRLFCISRGGPVNANLEAATAHGVAVTFAPGRNATATAEHTVGDDAGRDPPHPADPRRPRRRHLARRLLPLRPRRAPSWRTAPSGWSATGRSAAASHGWSPASARTSLVYDPYVAPEALRRGRGAGRAGRAAVPLGLRHPARAGDTREHRDDRRGAARPDAAGSVLVNCARGALVDYDAVCDALDSGHLFGAAFDVFPEEPIPAGVAAAAHAAHRHDPAPGGREQGDGAEGGDHRGGGRRAVPAGRGARALREPRGAEQAGMTRRRGDLSIRRTPNAGGLFGGGVWSGSMNTGGMNSGSPSRIRTTQSVEWICA